MEHLWKQTNSNNTMKYLSQVLLAAVSLAAVCGCADRKPRVAIVGVGINLKARAALYQRLKGLGIPLVNAIDPTVRLNRQATLGEGIVLCSFVHVGVCAHIGDNSFIGAHSSIDHHCQIGSTVFMGPGCLLSGTVRVGSGTLFGSGVLVQLGLTIGEGCRIASGVTVIKDLPAHRGLRNALHQEIRVLE